MLQGLIIAANSDPRLTRVFSTFTATNPMVRLNVDRDKAQVLGVPLNDLFQVLQASLGGFYVNDVNLFGRRWQVQVQAKIQVQADVVVRSDYLDADALRSAHLGYTDDVAATVESALAAAGPGARVCVLPEGPQTIPYVKA